MLIRMLKRPMPRSLYGRATLILLLPVLTIQLVVFVVFIQRLYEDVTEQMTRNVLLDVEYVVGLADGASDRQSAEARIAPVLQALELAVDWPAEPLRNDTRRWDDWSGREVIETLRDDLPGTTGIDLATDDDRVTVHAETLNGPLAVTFDRERVSASNPHQLLVLMVFTSILMTVIAFLFLRNQVRPIAQLARAAEAFGRGRLEPYHPSGATEVRVAGSAFLDMRHRIERHIEQRTMMLSGISHDMRTPITRLRLGLSMMEETDDTRELMRDVADMERLIDAFLTFARAEALDEVEMVDPRGIVQTVVEKAQRAGHDVTVAPAASSDLKLRLHPLAVERALENLTSNAVRYGRRAVVSLSAGQRAIRFTVEDDGPGIPAEARDEALKPFSRLDRARNQDRGTGVGLGLAIANDIARRHGGSLRLDESERLGGLRVDLIIPR